MGTTLEEMERRQAPQSGLRQAGGEALGLEETITREVMRELEPAVQSAVKRVLAGDATKKALALAAATAPPVPVAEKLSQADGRTSSKPGNQAVVTPARGGTYLRVDAISQRFEGE